MFDWNLTSKVMTNSNFFRIYLTSIVMSLMTKSYFEKNEQKMCDQRKGNRMQTSIYYQSEISPTSEHY